MSTHTHAVEAAAEALPAVPGEVTGVLHVLAAVGLVYVFSLGSVGFSPRGMELFGRSVGSRELLAGLLAGALLVASARWWAPVAFFLTGWQAFGLVALELGWLVQSTADGVDPWAVVMAAVGLGLLALPWMA